MINRQYDSTSATARCCSREPFDNINTAPKLSKGKLTLYTPWISKYLLPYDEKDFV